MRSANARSTASLSRTATAGGGGGGCVGDAVEVCHGSQHGTAGRWALDEVFVSVEHPAGQQGGGDLGLEVERQESG